MKRPSSLSLRIVRWKMGNRKDSIESELFEWDSWDEGEYMSIMFHDIVLNKDIGIYKKGTMFKWCQLDFNTSTILFGNEDPMGNYKLKLSILDVNGRESE